MVSNGSGGSRFDLKTFAMWFLWAINEYGEKQAREIMDEFLDSDKVKVLNTLWVLGIECDEIIDLKNGIKIIPLDSMPDSKDKTRFKKIDFDTFHFRATKPKAALVAECEIDKVASREYVKMPPGDVKKTFANTKLLEEWIDYSPKTPIKQGIKSFIKWYKDFYK